MVKPIEDATPDYDEELDAIVGWSINRKDSTVTLTTRRSTDGTTRQVPEEWVQMVNEGKLVDYWRSFGKPREVTVKCASYRVFRILQHRAGKAPRLLVHWVGYSADPKDGSASWEPLDVILRSSEALVLDYLHANGLTRQLTPKKRGLGGSGGGGGSNAGTPARGRRARTSSPAAEATTKTAALGAGAATTPAGTTKKRRAISEAPPAKRARKSDGGAAAADKGRDEEKEEEEEKEEKKKGKDGSDQENRLAMAVTPKIPARRGRPPKSATKAAVAATTVATIDTTTAAAAPAASSRQTRALPAPQSGGLFRLDLTISGIPHKDIQELLKHAAELTAQGKSVSVSTQVTPL